VGRRCLLLLLFALLVACSRDERPAAKRELPPLDDSPQDGGTLVRRLDVDVTTLNPVRATSRYDRYLDHYLFTPLVYLDKDLRPVAGAAQSWTISDDGLLYRFELNPKATFSDGSPVRASDVVFTLRKIIDPESIAPQIRGSFEHLDLARTRAVDDHTVEVAFLEPLATQLIRFTDVMPLPEHIYGKGSFRNDFNETAVGNGPYRLVSRDPGKGLVLERRDDYWGTRPYIRRIVFKVIADHGTAWDALRRGDIDETILASDTWLRERTNPTLTSLIDFQRFYTLNYNYIAWNERLPLFSDKRVRRALSMCVPIEGVIQDLYHGTARAMSGPFTPDDFAYNPTVPVIRYDPEGAKRILAEVGWRDGDGDGVLEKEGKKFAFDLMILSGGATTKQFAQMVQAELQKAGVQVEIRVIDISMGLQRIQEGNYEAAYLSWDLDPDPDPFSLFHSSQTPPRGQNFVFYKNAEVDRIIDEARRELDQTKRKELYWQLHKLLADDQPYTWTIQVSLKWGINKRVRGVNVSRGYGLFLWYPGELGWWIAHPAKR
jgi:peptide/nickel transport system substrate-binding protein